MWRSDRNLPVSLRLATWYSPGSLQRRSPPTAPSPITPTKEWPVLAQDGYPGQEALPKPQDDPAPPAPSQGEGPHRVCGAQARLARPLRGLRLLRAAHSGRGEQEESRATACKGKGC